MFSAVASGAWIAVLRLLSSSPADWRWEFLIAPSAFLIVFSALFLWIDRRWGEPPGPAVALTGAALALASALMLWPLYGAVQLEK
jgi:hypothetical protein